MSKPTCQELFEQNGEIKQIESLNNSIQSDWIFTALQNSFSSTLAAELISQLDDILDAPQEEKKDKLKTLISEYLEEAETTSNNSKTMVF